MAVCMSVFVINPLKPSLKPDNLTLLVTVHAMYRGPYFFPKQKMTKVL